MRRSYGLLFLNLAHFYNHLLILIFASVAALALTYEWDIGYAQLISYSVPGMFAYGFCTLPFGILADRCDHRLLILVYFLGSGLSCVAAALCNTPLQLSVCLFFLGVFSAIYHPVGLAMVVAMSRRLGMTLAVNGLFGNLGVAAAAVVSGYLIDWYSWEMAFIVPGLLSIITGVGYAFVSFTDRPEPDDAGDTTENVMARDVTAVANHLDKGVMLQVLLVVLLLSAVGGLLFQSTTFALPKIFEERMVGLVYSPSDIGEYVFWIFFVASFAQLAAGYFIDRFRLRPVFLVIVALQLGALYFMRDFTGAPLMLAALVLMISIFGQIPIVDTIVGVSVPGRWRGRAFAVRNVCSFLAAPLSVAFIAFIHTQWGFSIMFSVLFIAAIVSLCGVLLLPDRSVHRAAV